MKLITAILQSNRLFLILLIILFSGVGIRGWREFSQMPAAGEKIRITERLTEIPSQTGSRTSFKLKNIIVITDRKSTYNYGDWLVVTGQLKAKAGSSTISLLSQITTRFYLVYPQITKLDRPMAEGFARGNWWVKLVNRLYWVRQLIVKRFREMLPEPHASLISGMAVGEKTHIPEEFYKALRKTGTLHIVVASGMNITLVAGVLMVVLLRFISRRRAVWLVLAGIWLYAALAGLEAPIIRAGIMGSLSLWAMVTGREKDSGRALVLAGLIMLWINPWYLTDVGWQLSFSATAGIIWLYPIIKKYIRLDELAVTLAAQTATAPVILLMFGEIPWISPLVNTLVAAAVGPATILGGVVAITGSQVLSWGLWVILEYMVRIIELFGN